jgi:GTPase Era involved in 16S rRNA processing
MTRYSELRERILNTFPAVAESARRQGATETLHRLTGAEQRLRDGTLCVVVCGEFKRGKSSLLNALLDLHPGLLPEGPQVMTSVVTTLRYGPELLVTVTRDDGTGEPELVEIPPGELARYVTEDENSGNYLQVREVDIQLKNDHLEAGLVLVDTPGIRGIYDGHWLVTQAVLEEANAIVFITDVTEPLSDGEVDFLRSEAGRVQVTDDETGLIIVITKKDRPGVYEDPVAEVRARLAAALGRRAEQLPVVAVSSTAKQKYLARRSPAHLKHSNFTELEDLIWSALTRRQAKVLLLGALAELRRSTESLSEPVAEKITVLDSPSAADIAQLESDVQARFNHFDRQAAPDAPWRADLGEGMAAAVKEVKAAAVIALDESQERLIAKLRGLVDHPDRVGYTITSEAFGVVSAANYQLGLRATALQRKLEERTGLTIARTGIAHLAEPPAAEIRMRHRREPREIKSDKMMMGIVDGVGVAGGRAIGWALFPVVGSVVGEVVGGGIGFLIGATVTAFRHLKERAAQQDDKEATVRDLEVKVAVYYRDLGKHLDTEIDRKAREFSDGIGAELQSLIREQLASSAKSLSQVRGPAPADPASAVALRAQFAVELAALDRILGQLDTLEEAVIDLASGAAA